MDQGQGAGDADDGERRCGALSDGGKLRKAGDGAACAEGRCRGGAPALPPSGGVLPQLAAGGGGDVPLGGCALADRQGGFPQTQLGARAGGLFAASVV